MSGGRSVAALALLLPLHAAAEPLSLRIDAAKSRVEIELGATLHTVEGRATVLPGGRIDFDPDTGEAAGRVVIDARSLDTGIERRDRRLHAEVLESQRYPQIVFEATSIEVTERDASSARFRLHGELSIHGGRHPVTLAGDAAGSAPGRVEADAEVTLPYVAWGMRDVSNFLLSVDPEVRVAVSATGVVTPPMGRGAAARRPPLAHGRSPRPPRDP